MNRQNTVPAAEKDTDGDEADHADVAQQLRENEGKTGETVAK